MNNNVKKTKSSVFVRQKNTIIALGIIFAVLLAAYLFIIMPLMKDDTDVSETPISLIWENEVKGVNNKVMMFEHIERDYVDEITVHNPTLASKYGAKYVEWSIYRAKKGSEIDGFTIKEDTLYFRGYEYAPIYEDESTSTSALASIINDAGYTLALSRVTDHATDFSKYGLDYENDDEAIYCEITTVEGVSYKFYIGDKIPSGTAYYVRMAGTDVCMDKNSEFYGQEIENDSVYIYDCSALMISPTDAVSPILTYPMDSNEQAYFDMFSILKSNGDESDSETVIEFYAVNDSYKKKPISAFAPMALYYTTVPKGYYSSAAFEVLFESFLNGLMGSKVCELATLITPENEETKEVESYYGFEEGVFEKYFSDGPTYCISFSWNGFPNIVYVSEMTENGTYYAYSLVYNTICEVSADTLAFIRWDTTMFIEKEIFQMDIKQCGKIEISGTYFDYALESGEQAHEKWVEALFELAHGDDNSLKVTCTNANKGTMTENDWDSNFRILYQLLLTIGVRDSIDSEYADEIMNGEHFAEIKISSSEYTVYKTDEEGNETAVVDYVVPSMTRIFRFYKYTSGRCLVTIESIEEDGKCEGESGSFYLMTAGVELILKSTDSLINGEAISKYERN